jgi:hypothetical protein
VVAGDGSDPAPVLSFPDTRELANGQQGGAEALELRTVGLS